MNTTRTLAQDERGFHVERGKHRNLLNTAGTGRRNGTLGHRTNVRILKENDAAYNARARRRGGKVRTLPEPSRPVTRHSLRIIRHDVASLVIRAMALGLDPTNVATLARATQDASTHTVNVNMGAGRGW